MMKNLRQLILVLVCLTAPPSIAALPAVDASVRYMSLGDSLAAGYKAQPATEGYAYQLYLDRVFGSIRDTVFDNAAVPGATSGDVWRHQVPQVPLFQPNVVTMSVGGNDLLTLLESTDPLSQVESVLTQFGNSLFLILTQLCFDVPAGGAIYLHNLYTIPEIPGADQIVPLFNGTMTQVVKNVTDAGLCPDRTIAIADVYTAFLGQKNLLLIERYLRRGIQTTEVHPTNKGYRVMEEAFRSVIAP